MDPSLNSHRPWRIIFALISGLDFAILLVYIPAIYLAGLLNDSLYFGANLLLIFFFARLAIIFHEIGHVLAGYALKASVKRVVLGSGHEVARTVFGKVKIIVHAGIKSGFVVSIWPDTLAHLSLRKFVYLFSGVLMNVLLAVICFTMFDLSSLDEDISFATAFVIGNAVHVLNLIPFKSSRYGVTMYSDGWQMLRLLSATKRDDEYVVVEKIYEGYEMIEAKRFGEAEVLFENLLSEYPTNLVIRFNLAVALLKNRDVNGSLEVIGQLERMSSDTEFNRIYGYMCNTLAWLHLLEGNIDTAWRYAELAMSKSGKVLAVKGTYGCVLIEKGEIDKGIQILQATHHPRYPNSTTLTAASFLMLAYHQRRNYAFAEKYRKFVQANIENLDWDDQFLHQRNLQRIQSAANVEAVV